MESKKNMCCTNNKKTAVKYVCFMLAGILLGLAVSIVVFDSVVGAGVGLAIGYVIGLQCCYTNKSDKFGKSNTTKTSDL